MYRVLIATTGSLGDVHPMLAVARELKALGATVMFGASRCYRELCRESGFSLAELDASTDYVDSVGLSRSMLSRRGAIELLDRLHFRSLERLFTEVLAAAEGAHAIVAPLHFAPAHLVAESKRIPFIACAMGLGHSTLPTSVEAADPAVRSVVARWHVALGELRRSRKLSRRALPCTSMLLDVACVLGLFPRFLLNGGTRDVPGLQVVGYPQFAQPRPAARDDELLSFCDERTVVFSFGSFVDACDPDHFFNESVAACRMLDLKCVYLSRYVGRSGVKDVSARDVLLRDYVPHHELFPLVRAIVHHGGIGTLTTACALAKPMMIVPFFLDQPYHAARMQSLVGADCVPAGDYDRNSAAAGLGHTLLNHEAMERNLASLWAEEDDGAGHAARRILTVISRTEGQPLARCKHAEP